MNRFLVIVVLLLATIMEAKARVSHQSNTVVGNILSEASVTICTAVLLLLVAAFV
jgi:hypothetical protein